MHRNCFFTSIDDPSAFHNLDIIGADEVVLESDYPQADSTWPDTQSVFADELAHLPADVVAQIAFRTASRLYRHPEPEPGWVARVSAAGAAGAGAS